MKKFITPLLVIAMTLVAMNANAFTVENRMQKTSAGEKAFLKEVSKSLSKECPDVKVVITTSDRAWAGDLEPVPDIWYVTVSARTTDGRVLDGTAPYNGTQVKRIDALKAAFDLVFNVEEYAKD